jgi:hypothetical protein
LDEGEDTSDEYAPLLAYHYAEAARPEDADLVWGQDSQELERVGVRAVHWLKRAGELARGRYEMDEAIELYSRAVELCADEHERALLWGEIGRAQALRYDGEGMRTALLRSLEGPLDDVERADTYAFLAFQASIRSAMWSIRLNRHLIEDWARRALELAAEGSEAQARALLASVNIEPGDVPDELVLRAAECAERLGDLSLRSYAFGARSQGAFERCRFHEAATWSARRLELAAEIDDPDHLCEAYESGVPIAAAIGRAGEARRLGELHLELARRLSPHHRVHAISLELELADAFGDWPSLAEATDRMANAVAENLATPCVRNPRSLLLCALAHLCLGDEARAAALEREGHVIAGEGYDSYLSAPRIRMAILRGDRDAVETLVRLPLERTFVWGPAVFTTRIDALVALGEHEWIESEVAALAVAGTLVEPFALRALGAARRDDELLGRADERFAALGLDWHRLQTERLLAGL